MIALAPRRPDTAGVKGQSVMQKLTVASALDQLKASNADYARMIEHSSFDVGLYRPDKFDPQGPHRRDELYVIASGHGDFVCAGVVTSFAPGDVFFVPAQVEHRFSDFDDQFSAWVIFIGPRPS
ncbi:MAG: cupin domain-containing protein [Micropepsaceae bacterium]